MTYLTRSTLWRDILSSAVVKIDGLNQRHQVSGTGPRKPVSEQTFGQQLRAIGDQDESMIPLYNLLEDFNKRIKIASTTFGNLNPADITHIWIILKKRFQRHDLKGKSPQFHDDDGGEDFQNISTINLARLYTHYREFRDKTPLATRKRIYESPSLLPGPASRKSMLKSQATMSVTIFLWRPFAVFVEY